MCIRVRYAPISQTSFTPYDAEGNVVVLPDGLEPEWSMVALRAVLEELAVEQPESGAICWCGAVVHLTPRIPNQRRSGQVTNHGA
jgi:hypothetical protein